MQKKSNRLFPTRCFSEFISNGLLSGLLGEMPQVSPAIRAGPGRAGLAPGGTTGLQFPGLRWCPGKGLTQNPLL